MIKEHYTKNQFMKRVPGVIPVFIGEKSTIKNSEDAEQKSTTAWFKYNYPDYEMSYVHIPNEGTATHGGHRRDNKEKGLLSGAHDIVILAPRGMYGFMTLELKRSDHQSKVSEEQIQFSLQTISNGGYSCFAWGFEQAKIAIKEYMEQ